MVPGEKFGNNKQVTRGAVERIIEADAMVRKQQDQDKALRQQYTKSILLAQDLVLIPLPVDTA